jgi:hypothetical protein
MTEQPPSMTQRQRMLLEHQERVRQQQVLVWHTQLQYQGRLRTTKPQLPEPSHTALPHTGGASFPRRQEERGRLGQGGVGVRTQINPVVMHSHQSVAGPLRDSQGRGLPKSLAILHGGGCGGDDTVALPGMRGSPAVAGLLASTAAPSEGPLLPGRLVHRWRGLASPERPWGVPWAVQGRGQRSPESREGCGGGGGGNVDEADVSNQAGASSSESEDEWRERWAASRPRQRRWRRWRGGGEEGGEVAGGHSEDDAAEGLGGAAGMPAEEGPLSPFQAREGWLFKRWARHKRPARRWVVLRADALCYYTRPPAAHAAATTALQQGHDEGEQEQRAAASAATRVRGSVRWGQAELLPPTAAVHSAGGGGEGGGGGGADEAGVGGMDGHGWQCRTLQLRVGGRVLSLTAETAAEADAWRSSCAVAIARARAEPCISGEVAAEAGALAPARLALAHLDTVARVTTGERSPVAAAQIRLPPTAAPPLPAPVPPPRPPPPRDWWADLQQGSVARAPTPAASEPPAVTGPASSHGDAAWQRHGDDDDVRIISAQATPPPPPPPPAKRGGPKHDAQSTLPAPRGASDTGAAAVASFLAAVLTEIYLCNVCSCPEILRRNGRGQKERVAVLRRTAPRRRWGRPLHPCRRSWCHRLSSSSSRSSSSSSRSRSRSRVKLRSRSLLGARRGPCRRRPRHRCPRSRLRPSRSWPSRCRRRRGASPVRGPLRRCRGAFWLRFTYVPPVLVTKY